MRVYRHHLTGLGVAVVGIVLALTAASCTPREQATSIVGSDTTTTGDSASTLPTPTTPPVLLGPGFEEGLLRLGVLLPLSGQLEGNGQAVLAGHRAYWQYVNEELGGVAGFEVELVIGDNEYTLEGNDREFSAMQPEVLAISATLGSPITADLLAGAPSDMPIVVGSQVSVWGEHPNAIMNLGLSSYRDQIRAGASWVLEIADLASEDSAILYQEGLYGDDCAAGYEEATTVTALNDVVRVQVPSSETDFADELAEVRDAGAAILFVCLVPETLTSLIGGALAIDYSPLMVVSAQSYDISVPAAIGGEGGAESGLELLFPVHITGAIERDAPGSRLYTDNLERADVDPATAGWYVFMGYTQAATMHLILEEAIAGGDATRLGVLAAVDRLGEVDFGFGGGQASFGEDGAPVRAESLGQPVSSEQAPFGVKFDGLWLQP